LNCNIAAERKVKEWSELQDGQHILTTTPMVLLGYRLRVYRAEGTTQWFSAVTTSYNEDARVRKEGKQSLKWAHYSHGRCRVFHKLRTSKSVYKYDPCNSGMLAATEIVTVTF
jgi:hypothetical protein